VLVAFTDSLIETTRDIAAASGWWPARSPTRIRALQ